MTGQAAPAQNPAPRPAVFLRAPVAGDAQQFTALARKSQAFHAPWTTAPVDTDAFSAFISAMAHLDTHSFLVCKRGLPGQGDEIAGVVNITQVIMGALCSGYLGYYAFTGYERQGLMREGLLQVLGHAFGTLGLHRLEANIQPGNLASIALVRSCGFAKEGFSPRYLRIQGMWRDHERWAILADT